MPWPNLWAALFFLMMLILGIGSQFGGIEAINTTVLDQWPHLRDQQWKVRRNAIIIKLFKYRKLNFSQFHLNHIKGY